MAPIIKHIKSRGLMKVFYVGKSKDGKYYGRGRVSVPKELIGKKVYIITEEELLELSRKLSLTSCFNLKLLFGSYLSRSDINSLR